VIALAALSNEFEPEILVTFIVKSVKGRTANEAGSAEEGE
jgi:hypothetical protein